MRTSSSSKSGLFSLALLSLFVFFVFFLRMAAPVSLAAYTFNDVKTSDYYSDAVNYLVEKGWAEKRALYYPGTPIQRDEFAKLVSLFAELKLGDYPENFTDITSQSWSKSFVSTLSAYGLIQGYFENNQWLFKPGQALSRAEAAVLLNAVLEKGSGEPIAFADVPKNHWAAEAIGNLAALGVIKGKGNNLYGLNDSLNRADMAVILYRASMLPLKSLAMKEANPSGGSTSSGTPSSSTPDTTTPSSPSTSGTDTTSNNTSAGGTSSTPQVQGAAVLKDCDGTTLDISKAYKDRIVCFAGPDGLTLRGVFYKSAGLNLPTLVVLHGSGGVYSSNGGEVRETRDGVNALYADGIGSDLDDLPNLFASVGGMGMIVDSFTPRGYNDTMDKSLRPEGIELAKDAQFAKALLNSLQDEKGVRAANGQFALAGFSHGGGAVTLASIQNGNPLESFIQAPEFKYFANYYGGCGKIFDIEGDALYKNRAPINFFHGTEDSISEHCEALSKEAADSGAVDLQMTYYQGAGHGFFYKDGAEDVAAKEASLVALKADLKKWMGMSF